jgi:integrase
MWLERRGGDRRDSMMAIEEYVLKNGQISRGYKFTFHGRTYRRGLGPVSRKHAEHEERKARVQAAEGTHPLPKRQQRRLAEVGTSRVPTFLEFAPQFLTSYAADARARSVRTYEDRLNLHILPYFRDVRLDHATTAAIDAYRTARRQEGASAHTINGELDTLNHLLGKAAEWALISKAVLPVVRRLRVEEKPVRVLKTEEASRLLMASTPHLRPLIRFALQTGLRKTELLTLTWAAIDRTRREVTVIAMRAKNRHRRVVPLNTEALKALDEAYTRSERVFGYHSLSAPMDRAAKQAGLRGVNCHSFRRTFATRCEEAGIGIRTIQRWLGHGDLGTTQKYLNPSTDYERQAIELIAQAERTLHDRQSPRG